MATVTCRECGYETEADRMATEYDPEICRFCAEDNHSWYGPYGETALPYRHEQSRSKGR
jgi:hypothetical protein